jgi:hypothetical protein
MVKIIVVTLLWAAMGFLLLPRLFDQPHSGYVGAIGLLIGAWIGFPFGMSAYSGLRRWIAIGVLNILVTASFIITRFSATLELAVITTGCTLLASAISFFICAAIQRDLFGDSEMTAFETLLGLAFGRTRGYQIIENGVTTVPKQVAAPIMGPHLVIIKPDNTVVLEMGPKQTAIRGPGIARTRSYEYVKSIYDLREHSLPMQLDNVLTRDMMATIVRLKVMYRIDISLESRTGERRALTPEEIDIIQRIHSSTTDWKETARGAVEACVRQVIAGMSLRDTLSPAGSRRIEEDVRYLSNRMLDEWHITVHRLIAEEVRPSTPVMSTTERQWIATVETNTTMETERARAAAWRDALTLLADGYQRAQAMGMSEVAIHREAVRRTLEQVAKDPATKFILTPELSKALSSTP